MNKHLILIHFRWLSQQPGTSVRPDSVSPTRPPLRRSWTAPANISSWASRASGASRATIATICTKATRGTIATHPAIATGATTSSVTSTRTGTPITEIDSWLAASGMGCWWRTIPVSRTIALTWWFVAWWSAAMWQAVHAIACHLWRRIWNDRQRRFVRGEVVKWQKQELTW